jgi:hypothetical protein
MDCYVRFEVFTAVTMKNVVFCDIKPPVRTSKETCYFTATESIRLMLCKILSFHGDDYEECRLLRYKTPVRTSQETCYFTATKSIRLMLCQILSFHGDDYEECRLLRYKTPVRTSKETCYFAATESTRYVRFEVFTAVTMKNGVFWDVTPWDSCKKWRFGGTWRLYHQGDKNWWTRNVAVTSNRRTLRSVRFRMGAGATSLACQAAMHTRGPNVHIVEPVWNSRQAAWVTSVLPRNQQCFRISMQGDLVRQEVKMWPGRASLLRSLLPQ